MEYISTSLEKFIVIGISTRTSNADAQTDIPKLWQRFYSEGILEKIPDKINNEILSVYTDYESDYTKPYTLILCCKVNGVANIPDGMVSKTITASKYAVFTVSGKMPDKLIETWQYIWGSDLDRAYAADFDLYRDDKDKKNSGAEVYVTIK